VKPSRILALLAGSGFLVHGLAERKAKQIQALADPIPYEVLRREPEGEQAFVERPDGTRIRTLVAGDSDSPTVVLAHGYGVTLLAWNVIWALLRADGYRCIAFDLRGHGNSTIGSDGIGATQMAADYEAVLSHFDVRDAVLVGHSTGGFLAIRAILDRPAVSERLRGLVLFASTAGDVLVGSPQNRLQIPMLRLGIMTAVSRSPIYSWLFGASLCGDSPSPAVIRVLNELFSAQDHKALLPIIQALGDQSDYARLGEVSLPTVVVCGEKDQTTPRWHSEKLGQDIPDARNVWVAGKGHLLNWEAPEALIEAVESLMV